MFFGVPHDCQWFRISQQGYWGKSCLLPYDPPVHRVDDKDTAQVLPDMLGVWNGPAWKEALVVAIPKEGKPRHLPTSYSPVALTPHLGKVYQKLVNI